MSRNIYYVRLLNLESSVGRNILEELDKMIVESNVHGLPIIPRMLSDKINISEKEALDILLKCCTIGVLVMKYIIKCPLCKTTALENYSLIEIEDKIRRKEGFFIYCPNCKTEDVEIEETRDVFFFFEKNK